VPEHHRLLCTDSIFWAKLSQRNVNNFSATLSRRISQRNLVCVSTQRWVQIYVKKSESSCVCVYIHFCMCCTGGKESDCLLLLLFLCVFLCVVCGVWCVVCESVCV